MKVFPVISLASIKLKQPVVVKSIAAIKKVMREDMKLRRA